MMDCREFAIEKLGESKIKSPLLSVDFVPDDATVNYYNDSNDLAEYAKNGAPFPAFEEAGPRSRIFHDPAWSKAAILTAGGLCPGLNVVTKFIARTLHIQYGVPRVYGIRYGFRGLNPEYKLEPIMLDEDNIDSIHEDGGSILSSSRGRQDEETIVDTLVRMNINMLFCIGGDGTLRCAHDVARVVKERKLAISVIGIPKTIDNDIGFIDKSFGFETAVYASSLFVTAAHNEASGAYNGIGLIKVMGRDSGFIAAYTALANSHINYCLIPERSFSLDGIGGGSLLPDLEKRLLEKQHAVIIVAEGAGQELFAKHSVQTDASGNVLHDDIGLFLKAKITDYFKQKDIEVNLKYFDPSYTIRSGPARGTDAVFCTMLAQNAVHAALAGRTDMVVGHWHDAFTHVPISLATRQRKKVDLKSQLWTSVKSAIRL
jgi:6-phosphofructokinase 1